MSHGAKPVELSTDDARCETALRIGKAVQGFKRCYDALVVFMLPRAGQIPSESQHLGPQRLRLIISHLRPPLFIVLSKTAADASHNRPLIVIGSLRTENVQAAWLANDEFALTSSYLPVTC